MAIKKDMSKVAAAAHDNTGEPPDSQPRYGPALAQAWFESTDHNPNKAKAFETRLRNSQAGKCTREIQYAVLDVPKTDPPTAAGFWVMGLGTIVHERWQAAMKIAFPNAEAEVKIRYDDFDSSGHIDLVLNEDGYVTSIELKTINGFGFKKTIGARGVPEGPRNGHLLQCALNADAINADEMVVIYLSMENLSPFELRKLLGRDPEFETDFFRQFTAEWTYSREQYAPLAEAEKHRLTKVLEWTDRDQLVPRFTAEMPKGARITDPSKGTWQTVVDGQVTQAGSTWACDYCDYRKQCLQDGPGGSLPT